MAKTQHLEGYLSSTLKKFKLWYLKLQVNPLACTAMPADHLVYSGCNRILIECKETSSSRFDFRRLTQLSDLIIHNNESEWSHSYVLILFWKGRLAKSLLFFIDIEQMNEFMNNIPKKSANINDFMNHFEPITLDHIGEKLIYL